MFTLPGRKDGFRVIFPDNFLVDEIKEKYSTVLKAKHSFIYKPVDFISETVQKIQVFGFNNGALEQPQPNWGEPVRNSNRIKQNKFPMGGSLTQYRNQQSPIALIDKTLNVEFRHVLGYTNYMMLLENFIYLYSRDTKSDKIFDNIIIELFNNIGEVYAKITLFYPVINSMDMLDMDYSQPIAQSGTFKMEFKYSNFDYQFITYQDLENTDDKTIIHQTDETEVIYDDVYKF